MDWWKTAKIQHEANLSQKMRRWMYTHPQFSIPGLVVAGLSIIGILDSALQKLQSMSPEEQPAYVQKMEREIEGVFHRNPSVKRDAEELLQEKPELNNIQISPQEIKEPISKKENEKPVAKEFNARKLSEKERKSLPRGIRNNNPGNIDFNSKITWQGTSEEKNDGRFIIFETPEHGLRAMARVLRTYQRKHDLNTIRKIIGRWAPPSENKTDAYVNSVAKNAGVNPDKAVSLEDDNLLLAVMKAMIQHENGRNPYTDEQILRGIKME